MPSTEGMERVFASVSSRNAVGGRSIACDGFRQMTRLDVVRPSFGATHKTIIEKQQVFEFSGALGRAKTRKAVRRVGLHGFKTIEVTRHASRSDVLRPARDNPQTSFRGWSLPVHLRCTRSTGRAQQRNKAATGSSMVRLTIHPEPNLPKRFQWTPFAGPCQHLSMRSGDTSALDSLS